MSFLKKTFVLAPLETPLAYFWNNTVKKTSIMKFLMEFIILSVAFVFNAQLVLAADGSGTCTVIPTQAIENTMVTLTFTFTVAETMDGGSITIAAPGGWSAPQGISGTAGHTVASSTGTIGAVTFSGQTITVPITALSATQTITVVYGSGGDQSGARVQDLAGRGGMIAFATKSKSSALGTLTEIASSPMISLIVQTIADAIPPATALTDPIGGQVITGGTPDISSSPLVIKASSYTIWGTAVDIGGSTPQWVKVGIKPEGGVLVWHDAAAVGQSFSTWKYEWQNIGEGAYTIQTKSADWRGNNETPGDGVTVTIDFSASEVAPEVIPETPAPAEKPISEMTKAELEVKITEIQLKIIELLVKLIQIIQAQLAG